MPELLQRTDSARVERFLLGAAHHNRHTVSMNGIWLSVVIGAPWLAAIAWTWWHAPRLDVVPPSLGERARRRLETI